MLIIKLPSHASHVRGLISNLFKTFTLSVNSFKCPDWTTRDINKCYYKSEVLNVTEYLKSSNLGGLCSAACHCQEGVDGTRADFKCAHVDCPEFFNEHEPEKNCIKQYDLDHCCATKEVCGKYSDQAQKLFNEPFLIQMTRLTNCRPVNLKVNRIVKVRGFIRTSIAMSATAPKTLLTRQQLKIIRIATR